MAAKKDPLKMVPMRLPTSLINRLDKATTSFGKKTSRTAVTIRLINDGFKWWAREDLEQDTTLQMVTQMHDRLATVLAMQNVMAEAMGLTTGDAGDAFEAKVKNLKRAILTGKGTDNGLEPDAGGGGRVDAVDDGDDDMDSPGDGDDDEDDIDGDFRLPD